MKRIAMYAGSFDPLTNGHIDVIERAAKLFDEMIVVVSHNTSKKYLFTREERMILTKDALIHVPNVRVLPHTGGLTVEVAKSLGAIAMIRGVRTVQDYEFEQSVAAVNRMQDSEVETVILYSREEYRSLSSSFIKEIAQMGGNVKAMVPPSVELALEQKFAKIIQQNKAHKLES